LPPPLGSSFLNQFLALGHLGKLALKINPAAFRHKKAAIPNVMSSEVVEATASATKKPITPTAFHLAEAAVAPPNISSPTFTAPMIAPMAITAPFAQIIYLNSFAGPTVFPRAWQRIWVLGALPPIQPHTFPHGNDVIVFHPHWEVVILSGTTTVAFDTAKEPESISIRGSSQCGQFYPRVAVPPGLGKKSLAKPGASEWHNEARWDQRSPGQGG
jgi:hypothetical protein